MSPRSAAATRRRSPPTPRRPRWPRIDRCPTRAWVARCSTSTASTTPWRRSRRPSDWHPGTRRAWPVGPRRSSRPGAPPRRPACSTCSPRSRRPTAGCPTPATRPAGRSSWPNRGPAAATSKALVAELRGWSAGARRRGRARPGPPNARGAGPERSAAPQPGARRRGRGGRRRLEADLEPELPPEPAIDAGGLSIAIETAVESGDPGVVHQVILDAVALMRRAGLLDAAIDACQLGLTVAPADPDLHLALAELDLDHGWADAAADKLVILDRYVELTDNGPARERLRELVATRLPGDPRLSAPRRLTYTGHDVAGHPVDRRPGPSHDDRRHRDHRGPHLLAVPPDPRDAGGPAGHRGERPDRRVRRGALLQPPAPAPDPRDGRDRRRVRARGRVPARAPARARADRPGRLARLGLLAASTSGRPSTSPPRSPARRPCSPRRTTGR